MGGESLSHTAKMARLSGAASVLRNAQTSHTATRNLFYRPTSFKYMRMLIASFFVKAKRIQIQKSNKWRRLHKECTAQ